MSAQQLVFYLLVDENRLPYRGMNTLFVRLPLDAFALDLCNCVHAENSNILKEVAPGQLKVFTQDDVNFVNPLDADVLLDKLQANNKNNALRIVVPNVVTFTQPAQPAQLPEAQLIQFAEEVYNKREYIEQHSKPHDVIKFESLILGSKDIGKQIYVRPCYPSLLRTTLDIICSEDLHRLIILGNPGIGKSYFGYFMLIHLVSNGNTVVYQDAKTLILFKSTLHGKVFVGNQASFIKELEKDETFYITDTVTPITVNARTVMITSPKHDRWYQFSKQNATMIYMPVWSWEEIECCREKLFSLKVSQEEAKKLFDKWGGIARMVLRYAKKGAQQKLLDEAIDGADLSKFPRAVGEDLSVTDSNVSHRLIHILVTDDFASNGFVFASEYAVEKLLERLLHNEREKVVSFIRASNGIGDMAALRGNVFENYAHFALANGGDFRIRPLSSASSSAPSQSLDYLSLPRSETLRFDTSESLKSANRNIYLRPKAKNFPAVDAIIKPNILFQMTVSKEHKIKQKTLSDIVKALEDPTNIQLYFVVPDDMFESFPFQSYSDSKNNIIEPPNAKYPNIRDIQQYALCISLVSKT